MASKHLAGVVGGLLAAVAPTAASAQIFDGGLPAGYTCVGGCGTSAAVGNLTLAPGGGSRFGYVTSNGGTNGGGNVLGVSSSTNGSLLTSAAFSATAGQALSFAFNFLTTDGTSSFTDYAFVRLVGGTGGPIVLFTARTNPDAAGNTVPGFGLPGLAPGVTLTPGSTPIVAGAPTASNAILGGRNGQCYGTGCGYTGWITAKYNIADAGTYQLQFGVSNVGDTAWDTALAFDFATGTGGVPQSPSAVPEPATVALTGAGLLALAGYARRRRPA